MAELTANAFLQPEIRISQRFVELRSTFRIYFKLFKLELFDAVDVHLIRDFRAECRTLIGFFGFISSTKWFAL